MKAASGGRVPELDGLRGFAILIVALGHYISVPAPQRVERVLLGVASITWTGVDLFFVLSGFLIGGILLDAREADNYFRVFYARRFFRIFPLYYLWLLIYVLLLSAGRSFLQGHMHSGVVPRLGFDTWSYFLYLQNLGFAKDSPVSYWYLGPMWSLAVEEQFYLVAPLAIRFLSRRTLSRVLMMTVVTAPFVRLLVRAKLGPGFGYGLMVCRADALALGMLVAIAVRDPKFKRLALENRKLIKSAASVLAIGMIGIWIWAGNYLSLLAQTVGYTWIAFFYVTILFLAISFPGGLTSKLTRIKWLRELGCLSYCVYIIHRGVQLAVHVALRHGPPQLYDVGGILATVAALVLTLVIARASWSLFEQPLLRIGHQWSYNVHAEAITPALALEQNV